MWSWKNQVFVFLAAKFSIFCIQQELSKSNDKSKSVPKEITQIVSSQLFQEIYKVKYCLLTPIFVRKMMWFNLASERSTTYRKYLWDLRRLYKLGNRVLFYGSATSAVRNRIRNTNLNWVLKLRHSRVIIWNKINENKSNLFQSPYYKWSDFVILRTSTKTTLEDSSTASLSKMVSVTSKLESHIFQ